jgi:hypothetical protein
VHTVHHREALAGRWRWLGHPAFGAAVVVLALNDHVLKSRYPAWWTGKLSDVAGLAVVATLAAVLLGPGPGVAVAAAGFAALKTVPGVAEAARPLLGGVTLRDAGDLVALAVLPPLAWLLRSTPSPSPTTPTSSTPSSTGGPRRRAGPSATTAGTRGRPATRRPATTPTPSRRTRAATTSRSARRRRVRTTARATGCATST